jgi:6-phosphogluconolactonase
VIHIFGDADSAAGAAAAAVVSAASAAIAARGRFRVAFPGGTTPAPLFAALAAMPRGAIDWSRAELFTIDERAVPPDHPESNQASLARALIAPAAIDPARLRRMRGEASDLAAEARACEPWFVEPLDLIVLGVGPDGHVASLFPGHAAAREHERRVVAVVGSPKPPPRRLTITPRVIEEARAVLVLAAGEEKAAAVAAALEGAADPAELPARFARQGDWYLDRAAAGGLTGLPGA